MPVGRFAHKRLSQACAVEPPPAGALQNLRPFIFGDHSLDLQEELIIGRLRDRPLATRGETRPGGRVSRRHATSLSLGDRVRRTPTAAMNREAATRCSAARPAACMLCGSTVALAM